MNEDVLGEIDDESSNSLIAANDLPASLTFAAFDQEGRCLETCQLDIETNVEDLIVGLKDLQGFLRKFKSTCRFEVGGD
jgi:hypothetical protein